MYTSEQLYPRPHPDPPDPVASYIWQSSLVLIVPKQARCPIRHNQGNRLHSYDPGCYFQANLEPVHVHTQSRRSRRDIQKPMGHPDEGTAALIDFTNTLGKKLFEME